MPNTTTTNFINSIDQAFPVAGVDNNSQGFRDNFANIAQALTSINTDVDNLQINSVRLDRANNFSSNLIQQAQFQNCSETIYDGTGIVESGDITIDYSRGSYQKFILGAGTHNISIVNWPGNGQSGHLVAAFTTSTLFNTFINFASANLTNLSYDAFPFKLTQSVPYLFHVIYDGSSGQTFVKKLNERSLDATTVNINSEYVTGTYVTAVSSFKLGTNTYTVDENFATNVTADDSGTIRTGRIALLPNQITTTINNNTIPLNGTTSTTTFNISTSTGIGIGAKFTFTGTNTVFTVEAIDSTQITTQAFLKGKSVLSDGDTIVFTNPTFTNQPDLMSMVSTLPVSTTATVGDLRGQVYANTNSVYITFSDYAPGATNKIKLASNQDLNSTLPYGSIIMWYGSTGSVPSGWQLCNGTNGTPDLRNKFVVGAGGTYAVGTTGGSTDAIVPYHRHTVSDPGHSHNIANARAGSPNGGGPYLQGADNPGGGTTTDPANIGISATDFEGVSVTNANLPPYHALCYIMKIS